MRGDIWPMTGVSITLRRAPKPMEQPNGGDMSLEEYKAFVEAKTHLSGEFGFSQIYHNPFCHDFQSALIEWSLRLGRSATFADCGLGKTIQQLVWAENVHRHTNKPVLIMAPLSVSAQSVEEAEKFGIGAARSQNGKFKPGTNIVCANYERLHYFNADDFGGVACDESSILKNFDGAIRSHITQFMRKVKYRAMYTATPSPNDYTELGTSSEALGDMAYMTMLEHFFKSNDDIATSRPYRAGCGGSKDMQSLISGAGFHHGRALSASLLTWGSATKVGCCQN
ncbi:MAG: hypothetical protein U5N55_05090 [Cypionkella sp.]|nr:hypothetical protein [Cypionkella sp.]